MKPENVAAQLTGNLAPLAPAARAAVERQVARAISGATTREIMGFRTPDGRVLEPAPSVDYVKALWCFLREKPFEGGELESLINTPILEGVQAGLSEVLFSDAAIAGLLATSEVADVTAAVSGATRELTKDELEWLKREFSAAAGLPVSDTIQTKVTAVAVEQAALFFKTAAGATVLKVIASATATTAGKMMVAKLLKLAAAKAIASAAFKGVILGFVKKAGIVMLIKAALSGAVAAGLPMHRLKGLPPFAIPVALVGLIGAFLIHEIQQMPAKLANTLPGQIGAKVESEWAGITELYVATLAEEAFAQMS